MNSHRFKAYILLLIVALIWGIAGPVIKITLGSLPPDLFILYRFAISAIVSTIIFIINGIKIPKDKTSLWELVIYCLLNSTISLGLLFWGTSKTSLLDMSLIQLFGPLLLVAAGYFFLHDRITAREKIGTFIAFTGACIIGISPVINSSQGDGRLVGNLLVFLSLVSAAVCGILAKKLMRKGVSPSLMANLSFIVGFITVLPYVLICNGFPYLISPLSSLNSQAWLGIFYMALISGNLAYILNNIGQKSIELSEAAPFAYLYPIFSAILAVIFLGDTLTFPIVIGSMITLIGVLVAEMKKRRT